MVVERVGLYIAGQPESERSSQENDHGEITSDGSLLCVLSSQQGQKREIGNM